MARRRRAAAAQSPPSPPPEPPKRAEPGEARASSANALIALFLLFQIAMPLRYYLGGGGSDERFSWRMFSSVRLQRCKVRVSETLVEGGFDAEREVDLREQLHVAWIGMLERYRPQVVHKLLERRCGEPGVRAVRYARSCTHTDGRRLPSLEITRDCARGEIERSGKDAHLAQESLP